MLIALRRCNSHKSCMRGKSEEGSKFASFYGRSHTWAFERGKTFLRQQQVIQSIRNRWKFMNAKLSTVMTRKSIQKKLLITSFIFHHHPTPINISAVTNAMINVRDNFRQTRNSDDLKFIRKDSSSYFNWMSTLNNFSICLSRSFFTMRRNLCSVCDGANFLTYLQNSKKCQH